MRDEIFDREYQAGRDALHDGIDRLIHGLGQILARAPQDPVRRALEAEQAPARAARQGGDNATGRPSSRGLRQAGNAGDDFALIFEAIAGAFRGMSSASRLESRWSKLRHCGESF